VYRSLTSTGASWSVAPKASAQINNPFPAMPLTTIVSPFVDKAISANVDLPIAASIEESIRSQAAFTR
jgi:hypothetical protein